MKRVAIIGGGIAGVTAAYELARLSRAQPRRAGADVKVALFEASPRLGGIVETVREGGYIIDCGPDGWVTEKPWARSLAIELGLEAELLPSNDATRRTYILKDGTLQPIPDGLRMMVPTDLQALENSPLFTPAAIAAYKNEPTRAAELKEYATKQITDKSVASFVRRHFGEEVLTTIAAPLLSGVFGGDVNTLSVRAVMPVFVAMEREHGSLILALQAQALQLRTQAATQTQPIFTTLRTGTATLIDSMVAQIPQHWLRLSTPIRAIAPTQTGWTVTRQHSEPEPFDTVILATPADTSRALLTPHDARAAELLTMDASSAIIVAFALPNAAAFPIPPGFGFLIPPPNAGTQPTSRLMAATFTDQKFDHRVPPNGRLIRAFFGGATADRLATCGNDEIASIARMELARILGPLPDPQLTVVRRWPRSLPQYAVGHLDRIAELDTRIAAIPNLHLIGNAYRGVGLPDLIREARNTAHAIAH